MHSADTAPLRRFPAPVQPARWYRLREVAAALTCAILIALLVAQLDPGIDFARPARADTLHLLLLNALPATTAFALLLALTRRTVLSCWLTLLALAALYAANTAKLVTLQMPLLPADLRLLVEPAALRLLSQYLHVDAIRWLSIAGVFALTALLCRERRLSALAGWRAPAFGAVTLLLGASLMLGTSPWRRVYRSTELGFHPWSLADSSLHTGLIGSLLLYHWQIGTGDVPSADRDAAAALLRRYASDQRASAGASATPGELPDIVVVQSESLFDPERLQRVLSGRWLQDYHRLEQAARAGNLGVPTFAGGTIRTEFEVLTGAPLASLGGIQYPWLELHRSSYPGLVRVLDRHGYRSIAVHPNSAAFWNRAQAYSALGFERFVDGASFPKERIVGLFTADAALTDRVLDELAGDGPPRFVFAISMENHGPFDWRPGLDARRLAALPMPEELDAGARVWFGNYLYLLDDADHELGRLADALARRQRRTLLLFYGDHLPDLGPVYAQLGFDDGRAANAQPVPWLLFDSADPQPRRLDTRSWLLPALLLEAAGIDDDAYFRMLATFAHAHDFDADDPVTAAGINALARLQLRGELAPLVEQMSDIGAAGARRE